MKFFGNYKAAREACKLAVKNGNSNVFYVTPQFMYRVTDIDAENGGGDPLPLLFSSLWEVIYEFLEFHEDEENEIMFVFPNCFVKAIYKGENRSEVKLYDSKMNLLTSTICRYSTPNYNVLGMWAQNCLKAFHDMNAQDAAYNDAKEIAEIAEDILNED